VPELLAGAILAALVLYALLGGADYGGGVWDLFATGPRAAAQRALVAEAIAPVWEANHVWLILAIVVMFTAFPAAFTAITIALHVPLTLMLIGIVLRGAAFVFRAYDPDPGPGRQRWARLFAGASVVVPVLLGVIVGAIASGRVVLQDGRPLHGFVGSWLGAFPLAVGSLALSLFAHLAAVYLTVEAEDDALREDFRRRALAAQGMVVVTAAVTRALAADAAPLVHRGLAEVPWALPLRLGTGVCAAGGVAALVLRRYRLARVLAVGEVSAVLIGWAVAQYPYLVPPDLTIRGAAAPPTVLHAVTVAVVAGAPILLPSVAYLLWVFKPPR
jgi:cytochrome d ubiquinol oxidase subunit II